MTSFVETKFHGHYTLLEVWLRHQEKLAPSSRLLLALRIGLPTIRIETMAWLLARMGFHLAFGEDELRERLKSAFIDLHYAQMDSRAWVFSLGAMGRADANCKRGAATARANRPRRDAALAAVAKRYQRDDRREIIRKAWADIKDGLSEMYGRERGADAVMFSCAEWEQREAIAAARWLVESESLLPPTPSPSRAAIRARRPAKPRKPAEAPSGARA